MLPFTSLKHQRDEDEVICVGSRMHHPLDVDTGVAGRNSVQDMNQTVVSIAVAMMVPAIAVIFVVIDERKRVPEESPSPAIVARDPSAR
jgi:hypothetical protein